MQLNILYHQLKRVWRTYGNLNNLVIIVAVLIAISWAWGSISVMQTNFIAQKAVERQKQELILTELQVATLKYQQNYYKSSEYQELSARQSLGLVSPGEKVLILPENSDEAKERDREAIEVASRVIEELPTSNFLQWLNFFSGKDASGLK